MPLQVAYNHNGVHHKRLLYVSFTTVTGIAWLGIFSMVPGTPSARP